MHSDRPTFGLLVPHFGAFATRERVLAAGTLGEQYGFDALWVRDHLLWKAHGFETGDPTFLEPLSVLNAIGAVTSRILLGTAVLIPLRWPLKLAQDLATLSYLTGGRVIAGLGTGSNPAELAAAGFAADRRRVVLRETTEILRAVWEGDDVDYHGEIFDFTGASVHPKPVAPLPLWYGGTAPGSIKVAAKRYDGWISGRIPLPVLHERIALLEQLEQNRGTRIPRSLITLVKVAETTAEAWRGVDKHALLHSTESSEGRTAASSDRSTDDLAGIIAVGTPSDVAGQLAAVIEAGINHVVIDLRLQFDRFEETVAMLGEEVLPRLSSVVPA
jgi:alkanesulfonate monooxygenase SsuD/methylene tetrahydromethanopterin reductase-like flavin-dependent oxidoreductase (luciferase family)